jgi:diguanylate cyclase (GGDEF)-like protein
MTPAIGGSAARNETTVRILIAEDDATSALKLEAVLVKLGYEVIVARDGAAAWEILQRDDAPLLAILDWMMPHLEGIEVCRRVRQSERPRYVYMIMLTSKVGKVDMLAGMEAGADDYLGKPFDVDELRARLRSGERILALQETLIAQCTHDHLTGALNRGTILEILQRELAQVARKVVPVGIILADLDHFKLVNDTYGHAIGDAVLRGASRLLGLPMRQYDALGRYGGEEFLIVLPGCTLPLVLEVAERVRSSVASESINTAAGPISITVSLGVAAVEDGQSVHIDELLLAADDALYRAKDNGRNRVEVASTTARAAR